jgi:O-6-methylguanine DNA methyltransferase
MLDDYELISRMIACLSASPGAEERPVSAGVSGRVTDWLAGMRDSRVPNMPSLPTPVNPVKLVNIEAVVARWSGLTIADFIDVAASVTLDPLGNARRFTIEEDVNIDCDQLPNICVIGKADQRRQVVDYGFAVTPFGECLIGVTDGAICELSFQSVTEREAAVARLRATWPRLADRPDDALARELAEKVFARRVAPVEPVNLIVVATDFQLAVWRSLIRIPRGGVTTYGKIAEQIGSPTASRAVGAAVGANPIGYLIPCHRVVPKSGGTGNYRWDSLRKRAMLCREKAEVSPYFNTSPSRHRH